jgi:hypothetical protein
MRYAVVLLWNIYVGIVYWSNLRCPTGRGMRRKTIIIDNLIWISILIMKSMYKKIYVNLYSSPHSVVTCKGTQSSWRLYVTNHRASNPDDTPLARTHHHNHPTNSTIVTHAPDVVITCSLMRELPRAIPCEGRYRGTTCPRAESISHECGVMPTPEPTISAKRTSVVLCLYHLWLVLDDWFWDFEIYFCLNLDFDNFLSDKQAASFTISHKQRHISTSISRAC